MATYQPYQLTQRKPAQPATPTTPAVPAQGMAPPPPRPPTVRQAQAPQAAPNYTAATNVPAPVQKPAYQRSAQANQGAAMLPEVESFARQSLAAPSRYDIPLVQQGTNVINTAIQKQRADSQRSLAEMHASRGLIGSSVEADANRNLESDLSAQAQEQLFNLNRELAATQASDRGLAGQLALQTGEYGRSVGADAELANRYEFESGRATGRDTEDDIRARAGLQLQGMSQADSAELARAGLGLQASGQDFGQDLAAQGFLEDATRYRSDLGEGQYQFDTGTGLQAAQLGEGARQFDTSTAAGESQFARGLGLDYAGLGQQGAQFGQSLAEQRAGRIGSEGIAQQDVNLRAQALQQEAALQGRSLDITQATQQAEQAIAREQMTQQGGQFSQSLAEEQASRVGSQGLQQQDVNLRAQALVQEAKLQGRTLDLQQARDLATTQIQKEQLTEGQRQFNVGTATDESQFGRSLAEQQQARTGSQGIAQQDVNLRAQALVQEAKLEGRSMDLQQARDLATTQLSREQMTQSGSQFQQSFGAGEAERQFQQGMQGKEFTEGQRQFNTSQGTDTALRQRALDLQAQGMSQQDALARAELEFQKHVATQDRAFQYSQLGQQGSQFSQDLAFRSGDATADRQLSRDTMDPSKNLIAGRQLAIDEETARTDSFLKSLPVYQFMLNAMGGEGSGDFKWPAMPPDPNAPPRQYVAGDFDENGNWTGSGNPPPGFSRPPATTPPPNYGDWDYDYSAPRSSVVPQTGGWNLSGPMTQYGADGKALPSSPATSANYQQQLGENSAEDRLRLSLESNARNDAPSYYDAASGQYGPSKEFFDDRAREAATPRNPMAGFSELAYAGSGMFGGSGDISPGTYAAGQSQMSPAERAWYEEQLKYRGL